MSHIFLVSKVSAHKGHCASFSLCSLACNFKFDPDSDFDWSLCLLATPQLVEDVWSISQSAWWALGRGEVWGVGWSCKKWRDVSLFPPARVSQPSRWVAFFLHLLPLLFFLSPLLFLPPLELQHDTGSLQKARQHQSQGGELVFTLSPDSVAISHWFWDILWYVGDSNRLVTVWFNLS